MESFQIMLSRADTSLLQLNSTKPMLFAKEGLNTDVTLAIVKGFEKFSYVCIQLKRITEKS